MSFEMKNLLKTYKKDGVLVPRVERHLISRPVWDGRAIQVVHPSDIYPDDYCPRAVSARIVTGKVLQGETNLIRESIFADGHAYHDKWQGWAWDVGELEGEFRCLSCGHGDLDNPAWWDVAPTHCPSCGATRRFLRYAEVPVRSDEYMLSGRADGILHSTKHLLEVKSVGVGTIRMEAAALVSRCTHKVDGKNVLDLDALWKGVNQPFNQHIRQVNIYAAILNLEQSLGIERALLLYDFKPGGQYPKEFNIKLDPYIAEPYLERATEVKAAVERGEILACPEGGCKKCGPYDNETQEPEGQDVRGAVGEERDGVGGAADTGPAEGRPAAASRRRDKPVGPGADGSLPRADGVAGLLGGPAGGGGDRGRKRRQASSKGGGTIPRYQRRA
jgi:hypothetical protein